MQKPRKPARPAGAPRTYVLEIRGKSRVATRSDFAFAWQDRPDMSEVSDQEPVEAIINGVRHKGRLINGVFRWEKADD